MNAYLVSLSVHNPGRKRAVTECPPLLVLHQSDRDISPSVHIFTQVVFRTSLCGRTVTTMLETRGQLTFFPPATRLPSGFSYRPEFLTPEEEAELIGYIEDLPLFHPVQEGYAAKRRIMNFGWSYDFVKAKLIQGPSLPPFLRGTARKIAKWLDIPKHAVAEALITEYPKGAAIGWHRDNESFDSIVGISLSGWSNVRLRPIRSRLRHARTIRDIASIALEPRSAYLLAGASRWDFQHSIAHVNELRYSITFRTLPHIQKNR